MNEFSPPPKLKEGRVGGRNVLFIGTVFPEPNSSAAGIRTMGLVEDFLSKGDRLAFISPSDANGFSEELRKRGVETRQVTANDPAFDSWVKEFSPNVVVFDRFILEEQFGWRVAEHAPGALRILDTSDLHFLRRARGKWLNEALSAAKKAEGGRIPVSDLDRLYDSIEGLETTDCDRELAAIYRSDLTLVISTFEESLLANLGVPSELLFGMGFSYSSREKPLPLSERKHFVSIGNFRHPPNRDSVFWMARELWPKIREGLKRKGESGVELHIYGAYPPKEIMELDRPSEGFRVFGPVSDARETLERYRMLFAPLRFGAGIKGKIADAWSVGLPVLTTPIGAEGMVPASEVFPGWIERHEEALIDRAVNVYSDFPVLELRSKDGMRALAEWHSLEKNRSRLLDRVDSLLKEAALEAHRARNRIGRILLADWSGRTKYLSKWIEEKNRRQELEKQEGKIER